jgi:hypothetical protein
MYIHCSLLEQFSGSQSAFGTTFRVTGGYLKAGTSFLKRVTETIFIEAIRNYILNFLYNLEPGIVKIISAQTKKLNRF